MNSETDILYNKEQQLTLDLYWPTQNADSKPANSVDQQAALAIETPAKNNTASQNTKGTILLLHGGGWFRGDKQKEAFLAEKFTAQGYLVAAPNYRLAPAAIYPAAMTDVLAAFDWLKASGRLPKERPIFALGASAGGNLSIELALQRGIPAASWSGIIDMADWVKNHENVPAVMNQTQHFDEHESRQIDQDGQNESFYKWFVLNYVADDPALLQEATPLTRVSPQSGPLFLANSLHELVPISGALMLQKALAKANVVSEVKLLAGTIHGEGYWETALPATLDFFAEYLS